ncbi:hypothetical protein FNV43_RR17632 [Rhamnella rubrinervis]|uniref:Uncharacterized protein n=1 Tax=Rhamnella rubrinervis TaxID=2594499 RepID=A0A8K0DXX0_9ROSA|nr:hypothetical protein FNV43_RR17632 [Rhamnella rubrinervis]
MMSVRQTDLRKDVIGESEEREKTISNVRQVGDEKDRIVDPLVEISSARDNVIANSLTKISKDKDEMIDPLVEISNAKLVDSLAKISKAETIDFVADEISSANDDDELLKELESHLYRADRIL